jgi:hypothetical protein
MIRRLIEDGVDGIITNGTLGEMATLTLEDWKSFARVVVETVHALKPELPLFIGATTLNTHDTAARIEYLRLTVPLLKGEELRRLQGLLVQISEILPYQEYERWEVSHRAFHLGLVAHAGSRIVTMIAQLSDHAERYRLFYGKEAPENFHRGVREHRAIFDACLAHDPGRAAECLARHYSSIALSTLAILAPEHDPVLLRTALLSVLQGRSAGKNGGQDSQ